MNDVILHKVEGPSDRLDVWWAGVVRHISCPTCGVLQHYRDNPHTCIECKRVCNFQLVDDGN